MSRQRAELRPEPVGRLAKVAAIRIFPRRRCGADLALPLDEHATGRREFLKDHARRGRTTEAQPVQRASRFAESGAHAKRPEHREEAMPCRLKRLNQRTRLGEDRGGKDLQRGGRALQNTDRLQKHGEVGCLAREGLPGHLRGEATHRWERLIADGQDEIDRGLGAFAVGDCSVGPWGQIGVQYEVCRCSSFVQQIANPPDLPRRERRQRGPSPAPPERRFGRHSQ